MKRKGITDPGVAEVFFNYPEAIRDRLFQLRELIFQTAEETKGVGPLEEALRWGEPSYLTSASRSGTTIRLHTVRNEPNKYAIYFNCKTDLIERLHKKYPTQVKVSGNRAVLFDLREKIPLKIVKECILSALTYHMRKK